PAQRLGEGAVVSEAARGTLLEEWRGSPPYPPWSPTPFPTAQPLRAGGGPGGVRRGVPPCSRPRHGPGPFVTEDPTLELPEPHNADGRWQGGFRTGHFDAVALRYAMRVAGGADMVALTHLDTAAAHPELRICRGYDLGGQAPARPP